MKCSLCDGKGEYMHQCGGYRPCEHCNGTGKVDITNEDWFCSLSTEEKARFFACEFTIACDDYAYSGNKETWNEKYWLEWLKKEHK